MAEVTETIPLNSDNIDESYQAIKALMESFIIIFLEDFAYSIFYVLHSNVNTTN